MNQLKLSTKMAMLCLLFFSILFSPACRKDRLIKAPQSQVAIGITQEMINKWYETNPLSKLMSADWKNAKQAVLTGRHVVRVPILDVDNLTEHSIGSTVKNQVKANSINGVGVKAAISTTINGNQNYFSKHPPELFFIEDDHGKLQTFLLNFIPTDPNKEFGENGVWTGRLYEWNVKGDSVHVQDINKGDLHERYLLKLKHEALNDDLKGSLKSKKEASLTAPKDKQIAGFWSWLGDLLGDIVGEIGRLFGLSVYSENFGTDGGWRVQVKWEMLTGGGGSSSGGSGGTLGNTYEAGGMAIYDAYIPGYADMPQAGWVDYPNSGGGPGYDPNQPELDPTNIGEYDTVFDRESGEYITYKEIHEIFDYDQDLMDAIESETDLPPITVPFAGLFKSIEFLNEYRVLRAMHPNWLQAKCMAVATWNTMKAEFHFLLDLGGMVPVYGEALDILNGGIYYIEGDNLNAALSVGAAIPVYGWISTGGKWVKTASKVLTKPISEAAGKIAYRAIKSSRGAVRFVKVTVGSYNYAAIIALKAVKPADVTLTNLSRNLLEQMAHRIEPTLLALKNQVDDIILNADVLGTKTESLCDDLFQTNGFLKHEAKIGSNNGFDGVYIKHDASGNVTEIIVNEAKQVTAVGNIRLNPANQATNLPAQMSEAWMTKVINDLRFNQSTSVIGETLRINRAKIVRTVTGVDKTSGEIVILKLSSY